MCLDITPYKSTTSQINNFTALPAPYSEAHARWKGPASVRMRQRAAIIDIRSEKLEVRSEILVVQAYGC